MTSLFSLKESYLGKLLKVNSRDTGSAFLEKNSIVMITNALLF